MNEQQPSTAPKVIAWALALVLPPGLAAAALVDDIAADPLRAAFWAGVYLITIYVFRLIVLVGGKVETHLVDKISDRLLQTSQRLFSSFTRRYCEYIVQHHYDVDVRGLTYFGSYALEANRVFVDLSLVPAPIHTLTGDILEQRHREAESGDMVEPALERKSIWDYLDSKDGLVRLAVLGQPGSGKTTLFGHVCLQLAGQRSTRRTVPRGLRNKLPLFLALREHIQRIREAPDVTLPEIARAAVGPTVGPVPPGWFESRLAKGKFVVLLDGLDEVSSAADRKCVADWAERQMRTYSRNRFAVSSRPYAYQEHPLKGVTTLQVRHFTAEQVQRFLTQWYLATEIRRAGREDAIVRRRAADEARDLQERLSGHPKLDDLVVNPLLLTMIAHVHLYRAHLPGSRVDLYRDICLVFLGRRQSAKGISDDLSPEQKVLVLRSLALEMMRLRCRDMDRTDVCGIIKDPLLRVSQTIAPGEFLVHIENTSGLLSENEPGRYSFTHLTFQEYLAATELKERNLGTELLETVSDPWWRETTLLYAVQADVTEIVRACIQQDRPSVTALSLAADCLDEGRDFAPDIQAEFEQYVADLASSNDPMIRRVATGLRLTTALKQASRVGPDSLVCTTPISRALYDAFAADTRDVVHGFPRLDPGDVGDDPARGCLADRATRFAAWAQEMVGAEWRIRLPRETEMEKINGVSNLEIGEFGYWLEKEADGLQRFSGPMIPPPRVTFSWYASALGLLAVDANTILHSSDGIGQIVKAHIRDDVLRALIALCVTLAGYRAAHETQPAFEVSVGYLVKRTRDHVTIEAPGEYDAKVVDLAVELLATTCRFVPRVGADETHVWWRPLELDKVMRRVRRCQIAVATGDMRERFAGAATEAVSHCAELVGMAIPGMAESSTVPQSQQKLMRSAGRLSIWLALARLKTGTAGTATQTADGLLVKAALPPVRHGHASALDEWLLATPEVDSDVHSVRRQLLTAFVDLVNYDLRLMTNSCRSEGILLVKDSL